VSRPSRRNRTLLAPLIVLTLVLLVVDLGSGPGGVADQLRGGGAAVLGPAEKVTSGVVRSLSDAARGLSGSSRRDLDRLRRENDALRLPDRTAQDTQRRLAELDALLGTAGLGQYRILPARVVAASSPQDPRRLVTLDVGTRDGVRADRTVLSGGGLVGRVVRVAPTTCDVLLLTDPTFSVGVRLEATGLIGVATGAGTRPLGLRLLDAQTRVDRGARLVTLGSSKGTPFVPGVPVGEVGSVRTAPGTLSRSGTVEPYVEPAALDLVGVVVQPPRTDPRDSVLPPRPTANPTTGGPSTETPATGTATPKTPAGKPT
jgi:rod shape-determining protein MreC